MSQEQVLSFGPFELYRTRKLLLDNGTPVRLGSRALELLLVLVERAGEIVGKNELIASVWPDTIVEENNLRVHITALRKRLGEGQGGARYIVNVTGRGYSFVAPVRRLENALEPRAPSGRMSNLPAPISRPVGRSAAIGTVVSLLAKHRLVTLLGSGGIGKSTVALAAAEQMGDAFQGQVYFVDLAAVTEGTSPVAALCTVIGMSVSSNDPVKGLTTYLSDGRRLFVLDNCEHRVAEVAALVSSVLRVASGVTFLATSREPLLVEAEQIYPVPALALPDAAGTLSPTEALQFPAIQLFVERAGTGAENFQLTQETVEPVVSLCRRLDGIPLAIEIVAARVSLVGLNLLELGDDTGVLRVSGRRTAASRHSSLRATLDWSWRHLTSGERSVLQRLSVFRSQFSLAAALAVAGSGPDDPDPLEGIVALAGKSLLNSDVSGPEVSYRLLEVTRAYAAELLAASGEAAAAFARHARFFCEFLEAAIQDYSTLSRAQWLTLHLASLDDVRAALEWAFRTGGDERLGARLTVAAVTFGFQLSLMDEFKRRTERALEAARRFSPPDRDLDVRLTLALTNLQVRTADTDENLSADIDRMVMLTRDSASPRDVIWPLTNRTLMPLDFGDYSAALASFAELETVARQQDDPFSMLTADRVGAMAFHWAGHHGRARRLAERVLRHPALTIPLLYSHVSVDRRVSMRVVLARILWLEGYADQAREVVAEALELAGGDSPNAVCDVLGHAAIPIALWCGDQAAANELSLRLLEQTRRFTLTRWQFAALCFRALADPTCGDEDLAHANPLPGLQRDLMATLSTRWIDPITVARAEQQLAGWCSAELLRAVAVGPLSFRRSSVADSEAALQTSLRIAREQGALAWELRTALSLARLWQSQDLRHEATQLLVPVYERFTEGLATRDVLAAGELVLELQR